MQTSNSLTIPNQENDFWPTLFSLNPWVSFGLACIISWIVVYLQQEVLITEALYYNSLGEQMAYDRIALMIEQKEKMAWLTYALTPLSLFIQIVFVSICLNVGTILWEYEISFKTIFKMVAKATALFAVLSVIQTVPYLFTEVDTMEEMMNIDWFSLAALFQGTELPNWLILPLRMLNIVFLLYILVLAGGMHLLSKRRYSEMLSFVFGTYGLGLFLVVLTLIFVQLNMS